MSRESMPNIDKLLISLEKKTSKSLADKNIIRFSDKLLEQGDIVKVAFDVYRVDNDPYCDLWVLEEVDGAPHLVRASDPRTEQEVDGAWVVTSDYDKQNVTLSYKTLPIARFSSSEFGFTKDEIILFKSSILERVKGDDDFVKQIIAEQPTSKRQHISTAFPELKKFI